MHMNHEPSTGRMQIQTPDQQLPAAWGSSIIKRHSNLALSRGFVVLFIPHCTFSDATCRLRASTSPYRSLTCALSQNNFTTATKKLATLILLGLIESSSGELSTTYISSRAYCARHSFGSTRAHNITLLGDHGAGFCRRKSGRMFPTSLLISSVNPLPSRRRFLRT